MYHIKEFTREHIYEEPTGKSTILPTIINTKFPATRNVSVPYCESYIMAGSKKRSTGTNNIKPLTGKLGTMTRYKYEVGDVVSTDQFIYRNPG